MIGGVLRGNKNGVQLDQTACSTTCYRSILVSTSPCFLCRCLGVFSMHLVMYESCNQGITFPSQFAREILARVASQWIAGLIYVFWRGAKAGVPVSDARVLDLDLAMLGPVVYFQMPMFESLSHVKLNRNRMMAGMGIWLASASDKGRWD